MNEGKNDIAWRKLFDKYKIIEKIESKGEYLISADAIKEFREPRLMTKFDHESNLPKIFSDNNLAILPVSRGDYIISKFEAYAKFPKDDKNPDEVRRVPVPDYLESLMPEFLVSEAIALNCAYACGILKDFLGDSDLVPTVSGRMGSGEFEFNINTVSDPPSSHHITVRNSQIEIDAAYEGRNFLSLFEAKHDLLSDDFIIRQLYYPYRVWEARLTSSLWINPRDSFG